MKRFIICAAAAIVALASCSKTQVVYNDAPEEIGFKAISGVMTKEPVLDLIFPDDQPITVMAYNNAGKASYFTETVFKINDETSEWEADNAQYYPTTGSLDFVAYTEHATKDLVTVASTGNESYTYTLADNSSDQHDFMVSEYIVGIEKTSNAVAIPFRHALALIQVNIKCTGTNVTVTSVSLAGTKQAGEVTVEYSGADAANSNVAPTIGTWDVDGIAATELTKEEEMILTKGADFSPYAYFLVVPEDGTDGKVLTVNYELNGNSISHPINLTESAATTWVTGTKHKFDITIGLEEITFTPSIGVNWTSANAGTPSI